MLDKYGIAARKAMIKVMINTFLDILFVLMIIMTLVIGIIHLYSGDYQDRNEKEK